MSIWQGWVPPVPPPRQNPVQVEGQRPPLDETPLIKAIVDQMKACQRGSTTDGMSDIEFMIKKLKDYAHCNPLYISILSSLNSENDIAVIDSLYKDIDLVVWTYQFYDKYLSSPRTGGSTEHSTAPPLSLLSYPDFVEQVFQSFIVPTIQHINATNYNRVYSTVNGDRDGIPDTSTIMDLILCGTDIPIPESIYDLPKVLHEALEQTKHPPSTTTATVSSASSQVSLVFLNRNEQLRNHDLRDALQRRDERLAKICLEEETVRYNMLYLYILAHVAINVTSVHIRPFNNGNDLTLSNHASLPQLLNWKDTFQKMIEFHTFYSAQSMSYLVPLMIPIVELDWYCHPTKVCASSTNVMAPHNEESLIAFSRYAQDVSLESIISDLLKDRYVVGVVLHRLNLNSTSTSVSE